MGYRNETQYAGGINKELNELTNEVIVPGQQLLIQK